MYVVINKTSLKSANKKTPAIPMVLTKILIKSALYVLRPFTIASAPVKILWSLFPVFSLLCHSRENSVNLSKPQILALARALAPKILMKFLHCNLNKETKNQGIETNKI